MPDTSLEKLKGLFRQNLKTQRAQVPAEEAQAAAARLWDQLKDQPYFQRAKRVAAFTSTGSEISTRPLLEGILASGKELYLPKSDKTQTLIQFHQVTDLSTMVQGPFEIMEPKDGAVIAPNRIELILIPGLAFDNRGHRLGYGQGFYDRYLKVVDQSCFMLGVAYAFQIIDKTPNAEHDIPVNAVLTDKFIMLC